jgi:hypothetical protein
VAKTIYENIEAGTAVLCYFESDKVEDAPEPEATTEENAEAVETTETLGADPTTNANIEETPAAENAAEAQAAQVETPIESSQPHPAEEPETASGPSSDTASGEIIVPPLIQSGPGADQTELATISAVIEANVG